MFRKSGWLNRYHARAPCPSWKGQCLWYLQMRKKLFDMCVFVCEIVSRPDHVLQSIRQLVSLTTLCRTLGKKEREREEKDTFEWERALCCLLGVCCILFPSYLEHNNMGYWSPYYNLSTFSLFSLSSSSSLLLSLLLLGFESKHPYSHFLYSIALLPLLNTTRLLDGCCLL